VEFHGIGSVVADVEVGSKEEVDDLIDLPPRLILPILPLNPTYSLPHPFVHLILGKKKSRSVPRRRRAASSRTCLSLLTTTPTRLLRLNCGESFWRMEVVS